MFLAPTVLEISPFSMNKIGRDSYFRFTWQPEAEFDVFIAQSAVDLVGIGFGIVFLSRTVFKILMFQFSKGILHWEPGFWGKRGGKNFFFKILTPKRHILARKHAVWYIPRENRMNGVTCSLIEETKKILKKNYLVLYFGYPPGSNPLSEYHEIWYVWSLGVVIT